MLLLTILFLCGVAWADPMNMLLVPSPYINMNADYSQCITANLKYCQEAFATNINSSYSIWQNPKDMIKQLSLLYLDGMTGVTTCCSASQQYHYCLGTMYDACMNVPQFVSAGETQDNAFLIVQTMKKLEFDCNGGFAQLSQNDRCIGSVWILSANELDACDEKYSDEIAQKVDFCVAASHYEECTRSRFGTACNQEASWWQCERTRVGMNLNDFCPQNVCTVKTGSKASAPKPKLDYLQSLFDSYPQRRNMLKKLGEKHRSRA